VSVLHEQLPRCSACHASYLLLYQLLPHQLSHTVRVYQTNNRQDVSLWVSHLPHCCRIVSSWNNARDKQPFKKPFVKDAAEHWETAHKTLQLDASWWQARPGQVPSKSVSAQQSGASVKGLSKAGSTRMQPSPQQATQPVQQHPEQKQEQTKLQPQAEHQEMQHSADVERPTASGADGAPIDVAAKSLMLPMPTRNDDLADSATSPVPVSVHFLARMMMHHKHATQGTPTQVALDGITFYSK